MLADVALLDTLDGRQLRAGYAEVVKYALIGHQLLFDWLEEQRAAILGGDRGMREEAVSQCIMAKARLVEADPEDPRQIDMAEAWTAEQERQAAVGSPPAA